MKREVELYFIALLLVGIVFLFTFFYTGITGFAVFEQSTQSAFDEGTYNSLVFDSNSSAVILATNETSGDYTSKIFDAGNESTWNNLTWTGQGTLDFQVRACSTSDCANESFTTPSDLNNLNLTSQYFQYKVLFNQTGNETLALESVSLGYSTDSGTETSESENNIPVANDQSVETDENTALEITLSASDADNEALTFSIVDGPVSGELNNVTQIDNNSASVTYTPNTDFTGGDSLTFKANDGLNDSNTATVSITVNTVEEVEEEEEAEESESSTQIPATGAATLTPSYELSLEVTQSMDLSPGQSKQESILVTNTGESVLRSCVFKPLGDYAEWVSFTEEPFPLMKGDQQSVTFDVNVPEEISTGTYTLSASVECFETAVSKDISLNVVDVTFEFNLTDVRKIADDEVRATYELSDLSGEDQIIDLNFELLDNQSQKVSEATDSVNLTANEINEFDSIIPVNESIEGNLTIKVNANSQSYSSSVEEPIVLSAPPLLGFAIFDNAGAGSIALFAIVVAALLVLIFVVRKARKSNRFFGKE